MAYDFNRQHQNRQWNPNEQGHAGIRRPQEMRGVVSDSLFADPLDVVVDESTDRATQRNYRDRSRRFEAWNQTDQVADKDEKSQGHQERCEGRAAMADDFVALVFDEAVSAFKDVLQGARLVDG